MKPMHRYSPALVLPALLFSVATSFAQSGFTTKTYSAVSGDSKIRVADFNRDGKPDLLTYDPFVDDGFIQFNDGNGGFKSPVSLPSISSGLILTARVADMNGDGSPDIIACTDLSSRSSEIYSVVVYLNDGIGNFSVAQTTPVAGCRSLITGDVNLDGNQDVVIVYGTSANGSGPATNTIQTFFGDGTGKVGNPVTTSGLSFDMASTDGDSNCTAEDLTGGNFFLDNQFSLLVSSQCQPGYSTPSNYGTTFLAHGDGTGQFTTSYSTSPNGYFFNSQTADLNGDDRPDGLFLADGSDTGSFFVYYGVNNGGGNFSYTSLANANHFSGVTSADLNGDGSVDIAAITSNVARTSQSNGPDTISIYNGSSNGSFSAGQSWTVGDVNSTSGDLVSADFNGDGKADLVTLVSEQTNTGSTTQLYVYTSQTGSMGICSVPTTANTNIICAPAKGSTSTSPVAVTASSNVTGFTLNRLYLDNTSVYQVASQTVNTSITAANGTHTLVLVSYNNAGKAITTSTTFTVGSATPPPSGCSASAGAVSICSPAAGTTTGSPVTISASASALAGHITAVRGYIDGVAVFTVNNSSASPQQQVSQSVTVAPGSHNLTVVGYQNNGFALKASEAFTVGGTAPCYPSSAGVKICSPASGSTTSSPVNFVAGATAGSGYITAVRVYVDSVAKTLVNNPQQSKSFAINTPVAVTAGKHSIVVVGYQSTGGSVSASDSVTIQ